MTCAECWHREPLHQHSASRLDTSCKACTVCGRDCSRDDSHDFATHPSEPCLCARFEFPRPPADQNAAVVLGEKATPRPNPYLSERADLSGPAAEAPDLHDAAFRAGLWQTIEQRAKELKDRARAELSALPVGDAVTGRYGDRLIAKAAMTRGRTKLAVTDEHELLDWVRRNYPTEIIESVNPAFLTQIERAAKTVGAPIDAAGEVIPGLELQQGDPYVSVRRAPDALATVAFMLSEGLISLDGVKEIQ